MSRIPLLIVISVIFLFSFSSDGIAPIRTYAADTSGTVSPSSFAESAEETVSRVHFAQFADNLDEGRFFSTGDSTVITGSLESPAVVVVIDIIVSGIQGGIMGGLDSALLKGGAAPAKGVFKDQIDSLIDYVADFFKDDDNNNKDDETGRRISFSPNPECDFTDLAPHLPQCQRSGDPQMALLINSFEVEGKDILEDQISESMRPENIVLETRLHTFLGGATFIGSRAFSGDIFDSDNNEIPNSSVGFGVFKKDDGHKIFSVISFGPSLPEFERVRDLKIDFSPIAEEGSFEAEILQVVQAFDPDNEPPSRLTSPVDPGPPASINFTILDAGSGLALIGVTGRRNIKEVTEPSFPMGSVAPQVLTATKKDKSEESRIELTFSDLDGNVVQCSADF